MSTPPPRPLVWIAGCAGPGFTTGTYPEWTDTPRAVVAVAAALREALPEAQIAGPLLLAGPEAVAAHRADLQAAAVVVGVPAGGMAQVTFAALAQAARPVVLIADSPAGVHQVASGAAALRSAGIVTRLALSWSDGAAGLRHLLGTTSPPPPPCPPLSPSPSPSPSTTRHPEGNGCPPTTGARATASRAPTGELPSSGLPDEPGPPVVLLVGGTSPSVVDSQRDTAAFAARAGVRLAPVAWPEVLDRLDALPAGAPAAASADWGSGAGAVEVSPALLERNAALGVVLLQLAREYGAQAVAVDCMAGIAARRVTPCLAFSRLEDAGIVVGCEGDLTALWARLVLHSASGQPGFVANVGAIDQAANTVTFWHHTVPLSLAGGRLPYLLRPYGGQESGVHAMVTIPAGLAVTILRLDRDGQRATVAEGVVVDGTPPAGRTHSRAVVRIAAAEHFVTHLLGNHHALTPGHWGDALERRLTAAGMLVTRI